MSKSYEKDGKIQKDKLNNLMKSFNKEVDTKLKCKNIIKNDVNFFLSLDSENIYNLYRGESDIINKYYEEFSIEKLLLYLPLLFKVFSDIKSNETLWSLVKTFPDFNVFSLYFYMNENRGKLLNFISKSLGIVEDLKVFGDDEPLSLYSLIWKSSWIDLTNILFDKKIFNVLFPPNKYDLKTRQLIQQALTFILDILDSISKTGNKENVNHVDGIGFIYKTIKQLTDQLDIFSEVTITNNLTTDLVNFYNAFTKIDMSEIGGFIETVENVRTKITDNNSIPFAFFNFHRNPYKPNIITNYEKMHINTQNLLTNTLLSKNVYEISKRERSLFSSILTFLNSDSSAQSATGVQGDTRLLSDRNILINTIKEEKLAYEKAIKEYEKLKQDSRIQRSEKYENQIQVLYDSIRENENKLEEKNKELNSLKDLNISKMAKWINELEEKITQHFKQKIDEVYEFMGYISRTIPVSTRYIEAGFKQYLLGMPIIYFNDDSIVNADDYFTFKFKEFNNITYLHKVFNRLEDLTSSHLTNSISGTEINTNTSEIEYYQLLPNDSVHEIKFSSKDIDEYSWFANTTTTTEKKETFISKFKVFFQELIAYFNKLDQEEKYTENVNNILNLLIAYDVALNNKEDLIKWNAITNKIRGTRGGFRRTRSNRIKNYNKKTRRGRFHEGAVKSNSMNNSKTNKNQKKNRITKRRTYNNSIRKRMRKNMKKVNKTQKY